MAKLHIKQIDRRVLQKAVKTPSYFSEKILGMRLHWYQIDCIDDKFPNKVMCWSRQIGKSTMVAIYVVWYIFAHKNKNILILSQDRDASRRFYRLVTSMILKNPILADMIEGEALQSGTRFVNGCEMINKAPGREGKSVRGDSVDLLIIDEADFIAEEVFVAAEQTTAATYGAIILISTPNKKGSTFHQYFTEGLEARMKYEGKIPLDDDEEPYDEPVGRKFGFKAYHYDYQVGLEAIRDDGRAQLSEMIVNRMRNKSARWKFQQEYEAEWSDDTSSYFQTQSILNAINEDYDMMMSGAPNRVYYMGVDWAKHIDKTVVTIGEVQPDGRLRIVYVWESHGRDWELQFQDVTNISKRFKIKRAFLDGTGVGDSLFDRFNGVGSPLYRKCERVVMTLQKKNDMFQHLSNLINAGGLEMPHLKQLVDEMMYLQYEKMEASEYVKIHAPKGRHDIGDDYPDSIALMTLGIKKDVYGSFMGKSLPTIKHAYPNYWEADKVDPAAKFRDRFSPNAFEGAIITNSKGSFRVDRTQKKRQNRGRYQRRF